MRRSDCNFTATDLRVAMNLDETVPFSELRRKHHYYNCFTKFSQALGTKPAVMAHDFRLLYEKYNHLYYIPHDQ